MRIKKAHSGVLFFLINILMKWCIFVIISLLSLPSYAISLTQSQIQFINTGSTCCYSQAVLDKVNQPTYNYQPYTINLNLPPLKEPASKFTWSVFYALQVLDVYTTERALQYSCVEEVNPILGKSPTVNDVIRLKVLLLAPALWYTNKYETITDEDLAGANYMMTAVVANNFDVWSDAKHLPTCSKIR